MASLHMATHPLLSFKKAIATMMAPVLNTKDLRDLRLARVLGTTDSRKELVKVLERAANDDAFIAQLTYQGSKALQGYDLTSEEKAALLSGDIRWIEAHLGKLDKRLSTWLWCRLQQEIW